MKQFMLLLTIYFCQVFSIETNKTLVDVKQFCEKICSNPNWEFSFQEKASICLCWVDDSVDDIEVNAMQKKATEQGFTLWVIKNRQQRMRRGINDTSTIEPPISAETIPTQPQEILSTAEDKIKPVTIFDKIQEIKTRVSEKEDKLGRFDKSKTDPIVGDAPKLTPANRHRQNSLSRSCNPETLKLGLQSINLHIKRLTDRAGQPNPNCAVIISELESIKGSIQQLIIRNGERREHERPKLFDQIKEREKERQARIHSRLGHLDLPRKTLLNRVGSVHNAEKNVDKIRNDGKATIITQPKEFIDTRK